LPDRVVVPDLIRHPVADPMQAAFCLPPPIVVQLDFTGIPSIMEVERLLPAIDNPK